MYRDKKYCSILLDFWEPSWALCYVAFCLAIRYCSSLFLGFQKVHNEPSFRLVFNVCTLHVVHGAWRSRTLHKPNISSDLVFLPGILWSVGTSPMSQCRTSWRTFSTRIGRMLTLRWSSSTGAYPPLKFSVPEVWIWMHWRCTRSVNLHHAKLLTTNCRLNESKTLDILNVKKQCKFGRAIIFDIEWLTPI